jgi:osmotically-inducible protein OsmY
MRTTVYVTLLSVFSLGGCAPLILTGVAATGIVAAQERTPGAAIDDSLITATIHKKLMEQDPNNLFGHVSVESNEGRVLLTGKVHESRYMIDAVRLTWQVDGVREVINEIQVGQGTTFRDFARDSWITGRIKSRILFDKHVMSINYTIETVQGVVYLMGVAQNQEELDRVKGHASTIAGVQRVVSHVRIKGEPTEPLAQESAVREAAPTPMVEERNASSWGGDWH